MDEHNVSQSISPRITLLNFQYLLMKNLVWEVFLRKKMEASLSCRLYVNPVPKGPAFV